MSSTNLVITRCCFSSSCSSWHSFFLRNIVSVVWFLGTSTCFVFLVLFLGVVVLGVVFGEPNLPFPFNRPLLLTTALGVGVVVGIGLGVVVILGLGSGVWLPCGGCWFDWLLVTIGGLGGCLWWLLWVGSMVGLLTGGWVYLVIGCWWLLRFTGALVGWFRCCFRGCWCCWFVIPICCLVVVCWWCLGCGWV